MSIRIRNKILCKRIQLFKIKLSEFKNKLVILSQKFLIYINAFLSFNIYGIYQPRIVRKRTQTN